MSWFPAFKRRMKIECHPIPSEKGPSIRLLFGLKFDLYAEKLQLEDFKSTRKVISGLT